MISRAFPVLSALFLVALLPCDGLAQVVNKAGLERSAKLIGEQVSKVYPEAKFHVEDGVIRFESGTKAFEEDAIVLLPAGAVAPKVTIPGPAGKGVWCEIDYRDGSLEERPAYSRAEGKVAREHFSEWLHYIDDPKNDIHLVVTLRLPKKLGEEEQSFRKALLALLAKSETFREAD